ncbi:Ppx/GppA phosphatase family protein [Homoserinimonas hongtaonis]|uniref:Ppx/GppA phosphatase family protein n=1 Tax=Homoserinimonas hongtaonis TaxID=2079791 RepID=UPI000D34B09F|nr:Ppx/GppA phosphatase family protein [Salinibacterium hongtaonis]AWB88454.1 exopolyphosphatase [Salinibacterium hongtaonis]
MTRVAAFDCGTNSLRLLIADVEKGALADVVRTLQVVRLGEGVDRTGRFDDAALARTLEVTRHYAQTCREHGVERMRFVATSATRDAANRQEFIGSVRGILGIEPEVISGTEEAQLSFLGAASVLPASPGEQRLVVDLGGGSTELVLGDTAPTAAYSMDVGCVRLTERWVRTDPPSENEVAGIRGDVEAALDAAEGQIDLPAATDVIGVAGTVTTITAHALRLTAYEPDVINGSRLPLDAVLAACGELAAMPREERAALPFMHPGRVDVIAAGAVIWAAVLERVAQAGALTTVTTSEHDILDGIALQLGRRPA